MTFLIFRPVANFAYQSLDIAADYFPFLVACPAVIKFPNKMEPSITISPGVSRDMAIMMAIKSITSSDHNIGYCIPALFL